MERVDTQINPLLDASKKTQRPIHKVLVMGNFTYPQGMAGTKRVQLFIDELIASGNKVELLLIRQGERSLARKDVVAAGIYKGAQFKTIGKDLGLKLSLLWNLPLFFFGGLYQIAKKRMEGYNTVFLYATLDLENIFFVLWSKLLGYKLILDIVEDYNFVNDSNHLLARIKIASMRYLDKMNTRLADGLVVISTHLQKKYENLNTKKLPIVLVPISAHVEKPQHRTEFHHPIRIVYAGSFAQKDGVELLIDAVLKLSDLYACTVLLSGLGKNQPIIKEKYKDFSQVSFLGFLSDAEYYQFLNEADILCVPRVDMGFAHAGFPFKLGEYLATGLPVLTSGTGDVPFFLQHRENAIIVAAGSSQAIYEGLLSLVSNPAFAFELGEKGREVCQKNFNPQVNGQKLIQLISSIH